MTMLASKIDFPRFYAIPIFVVLCLKSGVDAFFEINSIKYLFFFMLLFGVFFMRTGRGFSLGEKSKASGNLQSILWVYIIIYFTFLTLVMVFHNGAPQLVFKIVSPFVFFGLVISASDDSLPLAIAVGAVLNIVANAALLPFDFGWTYWGGIHTFKGFYFFKTDLAYSLATSLLAFAAWNRYRLTPLYVVLTLLVVAQVVLANSRMNYLTLGIVLLFVALKNGAKPATLLMYGGFFGVLAVVFALLYDKASFLGFDTSNMGSFTQGRDRMVEVMLKYGLATYEPLELLFGRGLYADMIIYQDNIRDGVVQDAHNEYLHLLLTQGVFGLFLNLTGWVLLCKIAKSAGARQWASGLVGVVFLLYLTQGFTASLSSFSLKTWPVATILLLIFCSKDSQEASPVKGPRKKGWFGLTAS